MLIPRKEFRNAAFCSMTVVIAILIIWPVAEIGFDDDWSYIFSVKRLGETGHIIYNGWSSPSVITQAYWGLIWIKIFGFSFTALRFSTLPLAAGSVALSYLLARRGGLAANAAVFVALLLGGSPLFLPLATSFMTDVQGCFCILLSSYLLIECAQSLRRASAIRWLICGLIVAVIGGSSRQIVWVVPLALLPYIAWLRRNDARFITIAVLGWCGTLLTALSIQHWFERQPYSLPEPAISLEISNALHQPALMVSKFLTINLTLVLIVLPAGICVLYRLRGSIRLRVVFTGIFLAIGLLLPLRPFYAEAPWMTNLLTRYGIFGGSQISGAEPVVLMPPVRIALALTVYAVIAALFAMAILKLARPRATFKSAKTYFLHPSVDQPVNQMLILVTAGYLALLLTRCALDVTFDRHLMPLIPCAAIPLLVTGLRQKDGLQRPVSGVMWALLAVFGVYGIASTQSLQSLARARLTAAARVENAGIPRRQISAGFEFDYWTELETHGYIQVRQAKNPQGIYQPGAGQTPSVVPVFRIEFSPSPDTAGSEFGTVPYFSLLPPFHRHVSIDRVLHPSPR